MPSYQFTMRAEFKIAEYIRNETGYVCTKCGNDLWLSWDRYTKLWTREGEPILTGFLSCPSRNFWNSIVNAHDTLNVRATYHDFQIYEGDISNDDLILSAQIYNWTDFIVIDHEHHFIGEKLADES